MKINELVQIGTEEVKTVIPVLDEEDNETGEYQEVVKTVPIMQAVTRDMTEEEEAQHLAELAAMPEPEPTPEERIAKLESQLSALTSYMGVTGRWEGNAFVVEKATSGEGTEESPIVIQAFPFDVKPNTFYRYDGKVYVYMGQAGSVEGIGEMFAEW